MLIGDMIRRRAQISPQQEFWRDSRLSINYEQLHRDSNRIARALLGVQLRPGDHIAICAGNGYEYAAIHFGAAKAGLVLAHLNARLTAPEFARMVAHSDAQLLFFGESQGDMVAAVRQSLPLIRHWVCLPGEEPEAEVPEWAVSIGHFIADHDEAEPDLAPYAVEPGGPAVFPESPFQLLFTSGTTGLPKGVLISHKSKLNHGLTHVINMGLQPGDLVWSSLPMYHQFAQWLILVCIPLVGAAVVSAPSFDAGACWEALRGEGITHLPAVPTMLYRLMAHDASQGAPPRFCVASCMGARPWPPSISAICGCAFPEWPSSRGLDRRKWGIAWAC